MAGRKIVKLFKEMVETREPPIPYEKMLRWVQVMEILYHLFGFRVFEECSTHSDLLHGDQIMVVRV